MFDWLYEANFAALYPLTIVLIAGAAEVGAWLGWRTRAVADDAPDIGTLTGAALGLLALLLAFSFSLALSRHETRRNLVLQEANAISSTANFALMLPDSAQKPILSLLRDYTAVRIGLGVPYDPAKLAHDVNRSAELQSQLWQQAVSVTTTTPQSLSASRMVVSLNEMNNIQENRLTALRNHVPGVVMFLLVAVAMVATGFAGYHAAARGSHARVVTFIMSLTIASVIMLVIDLDRPARGRDPGAGAAADRRAAKNSAIAPAAGPRQRTRRSRGGLGIRFTGRSGFQPAMVRAHSRACALSVMPGNRRRSSTAAANSPRCSNAARIAAASASVTTNIAGAWARTVWPATGAEALATTPRGVTQYPSLMQQHTSNPRCSCRSSSRRL